MKDLIEREMKHFNLEKAIILQRYQAEMLQPFGDFMRDILFAVYQENIDTIYIVEDSNSFTREKVNKELQEKIEATHSTHMADDKRKSLINWLIGNQDAKMQDMVKVIQEYPFMPSNVVVKKLYIDKNEMKLVALQNN